MMYWKGYCVRKFFIYWSGALRSERTYLLLPNLTLRAMKD